jgi:superoxide dismutase, Fe-Mn family
MASMENSPSGNLSRRDALRLLSGGIAVAGLAAWARAEGTGVGSPGEAPALGWELPPLPYAADALEPHFDVRTMEIHHGRHHQAYLTNALRLLEPHPALRARGPEAIVRDLGSVPEGIRGGIRNNVGGHVNHAFFWRHLAPAAGAGPEGALAAALAAEFGGTEEFKRRFTEAALQRFGSGWAWLSVRQGRLVVHSTANQDSPLMEGLAPVLGLDVWEHAYYLKYQNRRADFVAAFWNVVDWRQAGRNHAAALA